MVVITECYDTLTNAIPAFKIKASAIACTTFDHWTVDEGILCKLLSDNGLQFVSMVFVEVYSTSGVINITTTEYPQKLSNGRNVSSLP